MTPSRPSSAEPSASPSAARTSSTVWCSSTSRSPPAISSRSSPPWKASSVSRWSRKPMPVAMRARPRPSRSSETRSAVSAVVRTTSAERVSAGDGRGSERGEDAVVLRRQADRDAKRPARRRTTSPCASQLVGAVGAADDDEVPGRGRAVEAGGEQSRAHPLSLGDRLLDVEPRVAERSGGNARRRRRDGRRVAPAVELARDVGRGDRVADAQRGEAERLRERPDGDEVRRARRSSGTTVFPPYSKYASSTTTAASGFARASAAISSGSTSSPVGLFGLQSQTRSASDGSSVSSAPSMPVATA